MSFGMKNVTIIFSQMTTKVFGMDKFLKKFVDDLNVHSLTGGEHIKHLQYVLMRLKDVNLKFNPNTCEFAKTNLTFMGHVEHWDNTQLDFRRIKVVTEFPIPTSVTNHYEKIMSIATCLFSCNLVLSNIFSCNLVVSDIF